MADETETIEAERDPAATPRPDPPPPDPSPEPEPDPVALERERAVRAEARAEALHDELTRARAAPPARPTPPLTAADIQAAFERNEITDTQRIQYLARLEAQTVQQRQQEEQRRLGYQQAVSAKLEPYLTRYPDLRVAGSALVNDVWTAVRALADEEGLDPNDPRTHLRVLVEKFGPVQGEGSIMPPRKIPVGTSYGTRSTGTAGPTADPLKGVPAPLLEYWTQKGYTRAEMLEELPHVNVARWARRA